MKFNLQGELYDRVSEEIAVGDVFPTKGGNGPAYWIVVAIGGREEGKTAKVLGINAEGEIISATSYYAHALTHRARVGFVSGLDDMTFDIEVL